MSSIEAHNEKVTSIRDHSENNLPFRNVAYIGSGENSYLCYCQLSSVSRQGHAVKLCTELFLLLQLARNSRDFKHTVVHNITKTLNGWGLYRLDNEKLGAKNA